MANCRTVLRAVPESGRQIGQIGTENTGQGAARFLSAPNAVARGKTVLRRTVTSRHILDVALPGNMKAHTFIDKIVGIPYRWA